jgi:tetratricopeptide (TPR) repeat protein
VRDEILRLGGRRGQRIFGELERAADSYRRDHDREAARILRPLRDELPDAPSVRELLGLVQYRLGNYPAATKELEAFIGLSGSVEQHPVLMDCCRAQKRWRKIEQLWLELGEASPSPELVTEGRIVMAGALADQGRMTDALSLLRRRTDGHKNPKDYHLRLWYALGDLEERAGNLSAARALFNRVRQHEAGFADVAERLAALA